jgi:hypothetical protein
MCFVWNCPEINIDSYACNVNKNSVVSVRERTVQTERQPLIGEVSSNFLRIEGGKWSTSRIPTAVFSAF